MSPEDEPPALAPGPGDVAAAEAIEPLPGTAPERLSDLADRFALDERQRRQLAVLLNAFHRDPTAPTSVREPERAVDVHIADALTALALAPVRAARRVADLGSGAGLPGLPLAIALPSASINLIESSSRKCRFLEQLVAAAEVANAHLICRRAEQWPEGAGAHDLVVARAVAPAPVVAEYAAPLLQVGGRLVDWRGLVGDKEEAQALAAAAILGLRREQVVRTEPFAGADRHHLHVYVKVRDTPHRFPRRAGMARKYPLPA